MDAPKYTYISGSKYKIAVESGTLNSNKLGHIDFWNQVITLASQQSNDLIKETLSHEIFHGIDQKIGASDRVEEAEHVGRASLLWGWLRDPRNQAVIEWLLASEAEGDHADSTVRHQDTTVGPDGRGRERGGPTES